MINTRLEVNYLSVNNLTQSFIFWIVENRI